MASTRFPAKPLARETGRFLIQHVYERVSSARKISAVIVATDDLRIADAVRSFGGRVEMTRADHVSGTDRIAEVVRRWAHDGPATDVERPLTHPATLPRDASDLILNVQGDEPEIEPDYLDRLVSRMEADPNCRMGTLACPFPAEADPRDPNCVKVVCDSRKRALYFSRSLIPYARDDVAAVDCSGWLLHIGVYAFRRDFLLEFAARPASALEKTERLEQLRALEAGDAVAVEMVERASPGVDTPADYAAFVARWHARQGRG